MTRFQAAKRYRMEMAFASASVASAWAGCFFFMLEWLSR